MIILHDQKLIFLKSRKVAGTSFELALSKFAGPDDVITPVTDKDEELRGRLGFCGPQNYKATFRDMIKWPRKAYLRRILSLGIPDKYYNHMSAREVKKLVGPRVWDSYSKLSIVRNPFDYAVSSYFWANAENRPDFENWCLQNAEIFGKNNSQYLIDQESIIDLWIRYENLEEDIKAIEEKIPGLSGLYETFSSINAKGGHRPKQGSTVEEMFAGKTQAISLIKSKSTYEIERFGYSFSPR